MQCYALTEISDIVWKVAFYAELHALQERFAKDAIVVVIRDLNADVPK